LGSKRELVRERRSKNLDKWLCPKDIKTSVEQGRKGLPVHSVYVEHKPLAWLTWVAGLVLSLCSYYSSFFPTGQLNSFFSWSLFWLFFPLSFFQWTLILLYNIKIFSSKTISFKNKLLSGERLCSQLVKAWLNNHRMGNWKAIS
jgi:hypothetical protein